MAEITGRITLKVPLTTKRFDPAQGEIEETITEVTVRPLTKTRELRCTDGHEGEVGKMIALVAFLTGLTIAQVDDMHPADFAACTEKAEGFMPPGLRTGETSSAT